MKAVFTALLLAASTAALNPGCSPGGNFDMSKWNLQLPIGQPGHPSTITPSQLEGCSGFQDQFFFTGVGDGSLVMRVPGSPSSTGCVTTPNSQHCRTELREVSPGSWDPRGPANRMRVTLAVIQPDESQRGTVIGQVHIDDSISSKPVCELYYNSNGAIVMGVEQTRAGGDSEFFVISTIPLEKTFIYEIRYENNELSVSVNDGDPIALPTFNLNAPLSYFKVGNYNQGNSASEIHFFDIQISH
ncbi:family 7 polysaccharide lyase, partial [Xylogone sp. PMI_703]